MICCSRPGRAILEGPEDIASDSGLLTVVEEHPSCLFQIDEIGRFLKTLTAKDMPHSGRDHDAADAAVSRRPNTVYKGKAYADNARTRQIINPNVVVYGTGVPKSSTRPWRTLPWSTARWPG